MTATIRKNSNGYGYKYTDLAEIHRYLEEVGETYYQEIETVDGEDYVITHIFDTSGKEIRKCRGCRVVKTSGKNPAQDYGSSLTYSRRYSLLLAFGLCTADDDGAALTVKPRVAKTERKALDKQTSNTDPFDRKAGMDTVKRMIDTGVLKLSDVQSEVRKYGVAKMQDLPLADFVKCVATLTRGA